MIETELNLTAQERSTLQEISRLTGKTEDELIREAVGQLIAEFQQENRLTRMQQAKGIWKDRDDLPAFEGERLVVNEIAGRNKADIVRREMARRGRSRRRSNFQIVGHAGVNS